MQGYTVFKVFLVLNQGFKRAFILCMCVGPNVYLSEKPNHGWRLRNLPKIEKLFDDSIYVMLNKVIPCGHYPDKFQ